MSSQSRPSSSSCASVSRARASMTESASGGCSRETAIFPSFTIPAFSRATSATVGPSSGWSRAIGVTTATSPATTFVASHTPPIPTSNTPRETGLSANHTKASAVRVSK